MRISDWSSDVCSRNLMTVRLAQAVGMEKVADYAKRFGVVDDLPQVLSMALGAGETTLLKMTTAYSEFVNGGSKITPRSEEHTSELQSLMRNSYAVFRLKKKNRTIY